MCILLDQEMTGEASTQGSDLDGTFGSVHRMKGSKPVPGYWPAKRTSATNGLVCR